MTIRRTSALRNLARSYREEHRQQSEARRDAIMNPTGAASIAGSATSALRAYQLERNSESSMGVPEDNSWIENIPKPVAGALRGLASFLEPFQMPQDAFFAVMAGAIDPETTIAQRLGRMQWGHYAPGGEAPERPADGQEIMRLMGFNETVSKWGGIGADLIVDPLVFGSWFRVAGKLTGAAELVTMGNRIDRMVSPAGALSDLNKFARRSESYAQWQDQAVHNLLRTVRNPDSTVFGIQRFGERATNFMDRFISQDTMLQVRFGREIGSDIELVRRQARIYGKDTVSSVLTDIQRVTAGANGDMRRDMVRSVFKSLDEHASVRDGILGQINSPLLREAVDTAVHSVIQEQKGVSFMAMGGRLPEGLDPGGRLASLGDELRASLVSGFATNETHNAEKLITDFLNQRMENVIAPKRNHIIEVAGDEARKLGHSVQEIETIQRRAAEVFDELLEATTTIDARIGLDTSGYTFIADNLRKRGLELGASPDEIEAIFHTILRTGLTQGQKGIDELWKTATNIQVRGPLYHSQKDVMRRVEDIRVRTNSVRGYMGELNSFKEAQRTSVRAPAGRYKAEVASARTIRDEAIAPARVERDASIEGFRQRGRVEQERLIDEAREIRNNRDAMIEELRSESAAARAATSDELREASLFEGQANRTRVERVVRAEPPPPLEAKGRMIRARVPAYFFDDYMDRLGNAGVVRPVVLKRLSREVDVEFDPGTWRHFLDDADFYVNEIGRELTFSDGVGRGAVNSARATLRRQDKATERALEGEEALRAEHARYVARAQEYEGMADSMGEAADWWREAERVQKLLDDHAAPSPIIREYSKVLFGDQERLVDRAAALAEATIRLSPQRLARSVTTDPVFSQLPETGRALRDARIRYDAAAEEIIFSERVTQEMANKFIKAEREVLEMVTEQERLLTEFRRLLGDAGTGSRAPSKRLNSLTRQVDAWLTEAGSLKVALEGSQAYKRRSVERIRETASDFRQGNLTAAQQVRADARTRLDAVDAERAAVRQSVAAGTAEARTHFGVAEGAAQQQYASTTAAARVVRDDAVAEAQARAAGARGSMEAEYDALGRGKPGSAKDRVYVAKETSGIPPRELIEEANPLALRGTNTSMDEILAARLERAENRLRRGGRQDSEASIMNLTDEAVEELLREPITYGELLQGISEMQALKLGDYLSGLMDGHLRKAYGLFMDGQNFQTYIDRVRRGSIMSGALLDEMNLKQMLPGFELEAELIGGYHNALKAAGGGKILRRAGIEAHLAENGVSAQRINQTMENIIRGMSDNPAFHDVIDILKERQARYISQIREAQRIAAGSDTPMVANRRFFEEQVDMPERIAATLGEHAQATLSLHEGARVAERVLGRQEYTQRLYSLARDNGLIKSAPFVNQFGTRYVRLGTSDNAMGGFGGQWVHPYMVKELQRLAAVEPQLFGAGFQRLRSLITGGYLAAPSVLAANFVGGFYQAATAGINPVVMARRMAEVLPDMVKASKGEVTELMAALKRHVDLEMSSLIGSDRIEDFSRLIARNIEMSPEGMSKFADDIARRYEDFLQRPGFGRIRVPFAGLEGFQFTENWFKVAAFKEMREQLIREGLPATRGGAARRSLTPAQIDEVAAEYARTVVFDYSQLPSGLEKLKQSGLVMFPGFPYFLASRTIGAALNRPGTLAVADRLTEALSNISLDPLDQIAAYLGMPGHLREEQGVPLPFSVRSGSGGYDQVSMIPFAQLVPTATIWDGLFGKGLGTNPWAESITQGGMWGPLYDVLTALVFNEGEATVTARFGHRVHDPGAEGGEKAAQVMRFLWNTMAPSLVRRGIREDYQGQLVGMLPGIHELLSGLGSDMPEELAKVLYTFDERRTGRPDRTWREEMVSSFIRNPTVVALEGPLAGIREEMEKARDSLNRELGSLTTQYRRAQEEGNNAQAQRIFERMETKRNEFNETWLEYVNFHRANTQRRQQQREAQAR